MTPRAIVQAAVQAGLDLIAICDHNSADNAAAVQAAAQRHADNHITVLAGIEITAAEEVHLIGIFPNAEAAVLVGAKVRSTLPTLGGSARLYGDQWIMNADGEKIARETHMLSMASAFPLADAVAMVRDHDGLAIAAHVDRPAFSVTSQLGFFPENLRFDALEISAAGIRGGRQETFAHLGMPLIAASDAHCPDEIGGCRTLFAMESPDFQSLVETLRCDPREGRCVIA